MISMARRDVLPAAMAYSADLTRSALDKKALSAAISVDYETALASKISKLVECLCNNVDELEAAVINSKDEEDTEDCAKFFSNTVFEKMCLVRQAADELETIVASKYWPYPIYSDILFSV
jgi:glutamine synthetase